MSATAGITVTCAGALWMSGFTVLAIHTLDNPPERPLTNPTIAGWNAQLRSEKNEAFRDARRAGLSAVPGLAVSLIGIAMAAGSERTDPTSPVDIAQTPPST